MDLGAGMYLQPPQTGANDDTGGIDAMFDESALETFIRVPFVNVWGYHCQIERFWVSEVTVSSVVKDLVETLMGSVHLLPNQQMLYISSQLR